MTDIMAGDVVDGVESDTEIVRNMQVESILDSWRLKFELVPDYPVEKIQDVADQQVRDVSNRGASRYVEEYYQQYEAGAKFPPIVLRSNGAIIDGNTRLAMWRKAKRSTVPVYLVDVVSTDWAQTLGAQLNQIGGVRLTPDESARMALKMLDLEQFTESEIARVVGRSRHQVTRWRQEREFQARAEKAGVVEEVRHIRDPHKRAISKVVQLKPFAELVRLTSSRKVPNADLNELVEKVVGAESEEAALAAITETAEALMPMGPGGTSVAVNPKARRMRMVLPQVLNLAPAEQYFEPARAKEDRAMWLDLRKAADAAIAMYDRHLAQMLEVDA